LTGIYLTQYYNPDPAVAHESVWRIITSVSFGKFIRGFHYWAAMAMIVLIGLHLLRVFVAGSFKRPREANWFFGVILAGITATLFFTGTVLKWDQESLEALEHNIEIGKLLGRFGFWFSPSFGGIPFLTRLYVVHIAVLPFLFTVVVTVHLLLVKRLKMAPSPFRKGSRTRTDATVHQAPGRARGFGPDTDRGPHHPRGARATAAPSGADRGDRDHQAAVADVVGLSDRGLGRGRGDPLGHARDLPRTVPGAARGSHP